METTFVKIMGLLNIIFGVIIIIITFFKNDNIGFLGLAMFILGFKLVEYEKVK